MQADGLRIAVNGKAAGVVKGTDLSRVGTTSSLARLAPPVAQQQLAGWLANNVITTT